MTVNLTVKNCIDIACNFTVAYHFWKWKITYNLQWITVNWHSQNALHFKFDVFFCCCWNNCFFLVSSYQFCTLGLYVKSNVVKLMSIVLFQFHVCYHDGPIQTSCSNTLSSMRTRHFSHTAVCTQSHKRLSNICVYMLMHFKSSCTDPQPAAWLTMFLSAHVQYLCEAFIFYF